MTKTEQIKDILNMKSNLESVTITPDMARKLIQFNTCNRKLSDTAVNNYAKQMMENKWMSDTNMITFSEEGELTNGQHRINAIIKADVPVTFVVQMNVNNFTEMDRGKSRTIIDNLMLEEKFRGMEVTRNKDIPSVVATLYRSITGSIRADVDSISKILEKYADDLVFLRDEGVLFGYKTVNRKQLSGAMLVAYVNGVNLGLLRHIRDVMNTGICECDTDKPIIALRDIILKQKGNGIRIDKELYKQCLYCIQACENGSTRKYCRALNPKYTITW